jgi:putative transposase
MESFFSSPKIERTGRKTDRSRDQAKADVFDYIERPYDAKRRQSTIRLYEPHRVRDARGIRLMVSTEPHAKMYFSHGFSKVVT